MSRVVYIGAPEADAAAFETRLRADFPGLDLFATNDRAAAAAHAAAAEALIGHHFQFDEALLERAPALRWIQSLTTGTDAILRLRRCDPRSRSLPRAACTARRCRSWCSCTCWR